MNAIQRTFMPGSRCIYMKLYTGEKTADDLLVKVVSPLIQKLKKKQFIEKWFFIRFADPDFHLRIRIFLYDAQLADNVIGLFQQKLQKWNTDCLLWKMQIDTYERELERYGKYMIEETESVFYADSECILSIVKNLNNNENYRWMIALKLIEELLSDFGLTMKKKQKLIENVSKSYKTEFGFNDFNAKQFNTKFRENKKLVESVLNNTITDKAFIILYQPIKKRTKQIMPIVDQIKSKSKNDSSISELLKNYLHMMINRLFRSKNRLHELILYDFMLRYYTSEIAKEKNNKKVNICME